MFNWQQDCKREAREYGCVHTLLGRARVLSSMADSSSRSSKRSYRMSSCEYPRCRFLNSLTNEGHAMP